MNSDIYQTLESTFPYAGQNNIRDTVSKLQKSNKASIVKTDYEALCQIIMQEYKYLCYSEIVQIISELHYKNDENMQYLACMY
jgi:hypothetical protein